MKFFWRSPFIDSHQMWNATWLQTMFMLLCCPILVAFIWKAVPAIAMTYVVTFVLAFANLWILWLQRHSKPARWASWIYFYNVLLAAAGVVINQHFWLAASVPFQAFFGLKFAAIVIALQAPSNRRVVWASFAVLFSAPLIQYLFWNSLQRAAVGIQEPGITVLTVACAAFLYEQRLQLYEMLERKARLEATAMSMRRYAHLLLGAHHLMNTPLQIIEGTAEMIRFKHPEVQPLLEKIDRAFTPIQEVNRLMSFGRQHVDWGEVQLPTSVQDLEKEILRLADAGISERTAEPRATD